MTAKRTLALGILIMLAAIGGVLLMLRTQPDIPDEAGAPGPAGDPLALAQVRELAEAGLDVGPTTDHELAIMPDEGGQVRVVFSQDFLDRVGEDLLENLGMYSRDQTMGWRTFQELTHRFHLNEEQMTGKPCSHGHAHGGANAASDAGRHAHDTHEY